MYPTKNTTAVKCAKQFRKLMKERPQFWAENVVDAMSDCTESKEQLNFLRYMADPTGCTPGRNKDIKTHTVDPKAATFFSHPDFKLTGTEMGKLPTFRFKYCPDEEKSFL